MPFKIKQSNVKNKKAGNTDDGNDVCYFEKKARDPSLDKNNYYNQDSTVKNVSTNFVGDQIIQLMDWKSSFVHYWAYRVQYYSYAKSTCPCLCCKGYKAKA